MIKENDLKGWTKKLSRKEKEHLRRTAAVKTTRDLKRQMEYTISEYKKSSRGLYCYECLQIAKKLKLL